MKQKEKMYLVNWAFLSAVLFPIAEGEYYRRLLRKSRGGRIPLKDRNEAICYLISLANKKDHTLTEKDIAICFGLSSASRIRQIAGGFGFKIIPMHTRRKAKFRRWLYDLTCEDGRERIEAVMRLVAKDKRFWVQRSTHGGTTSIRLLPKRIMGKLGYPYSLSGNKAYKIFLYLLGRGFIEETEYIAVVLRYGLGIKDPYEYLYRIYVERNKTLEQTREWLLKRTKAKKCLDPGSSSGIERYIRFLGIESKPRVRNNP